MILAAVPVATSAIVGIVVVEIGIEAEESVTVAPEVAMVAAASVKCMPSSSMAAAAKCVPASSMAAALKYVPASSMAAAEMSASAHAATTMAAAPVTSALAADQNQRRRILIATSGRCDRRAGEDQSGSRSGHHNQVSEPHGSVLLDT